MKIITERIKNLPGFNPGPMTFQGTNNYLIGSGAQRLLIDTGEGKPEFLALLQSLDCEITSVVITHHHRDHTGGIRQILDIFPKAQIFKNLQKNLQADKDIQIEFNFQYQELINGQIFIGEGYNLEAIYMPGHCEDHFSFYLHEEQTWFSADCILGNGSSTYIENLKDYFNSLNSILTRQILRLCPGHGDLYEEDCTTVIQKQIQHKLAREQQIIAVIDQDSTIDDILKRVYPQLKDETLIKAASNNIFVHLKKLISDGVVVLNHNNLYSKI